MNLHLFDDLIAWLKSHTGQETWSLAVYAVAPGESDDQPARLRCVGSSEAGPDAVDELVAYAATVTKTTIVGDVAEFAAALSNSSELQKYVQATPLGAELLQRPPAPGVTGSVVAAPCFDPWQYFANSRAQRRIIGALAVRGNVPPNVVVDNADLRYFVESSANVAAAAILPEGDRPEVKLTYDGWTLPDIQVLPQAESGSGARAAGVPDLAVHIDVPSPVGPQSAVAYIPRYERVVEIQPHQRVRLTGYSKDFEPYRSQGERWVRFGPGFVMSQSGLDAYTREYLRQQANEAYLRDLEQFMVR